MKTVKQHLQSLPKELRGEALNKAHYLFQNNKANKLSTAILYSYLWKDDPFWDSFCEALIWADRYDYPPSKIKSFFNP